MNGTEPAVILCSVLIGVIKLKTCNKTIRGLVEKVGDVFGLKLISRLASPLIKSFHPFSTLNSGETETFEHRFKIRDLKMHFQFLSVDR